MNNVTLYKVGGCVRDEILGVPFNDVDYSVEADSFEDMKTYIQSVGKIFLETPEYLTIRAKVDGEVLDFVLCRSEGKYSDGRRPDEVEPGTIYDDLARRDFTMNAIAKLPNGQFIDPYDGIQDIEYKIIRCVGSAEERFREDSLRMLRAIRFSITKGFMMDKEIVDCLERRSMVLLLCNVSVERIREELTKCFAFDTMETLRVLNRFTLVRDFIFNNTNIRLMPTTKK